MDIRSFFGSTKKPSLTPAAATAPETEKPTETKKPVPVDPPVTTAKKATQRKTKRDEDDDEFVLIDSDDDTKMKKSPKKRLQKNNDMVKEGLASKHFSAAAESKSDAVESPKKKREQEDGAAVDLTAMSPLTASKKPPLQKTSVAAAPVPAPVKAEQAQPAPKKRALPSTVLHPSAALAETEPKEEPKPAPSSAAKKSAPKIKTSSSAAQTSSSSSTTKLYFTDMKIAVTGVFSRMSRERIEDFIQEQGGKISSAVSGKTNLLVTGSQLEDGREVTTSSKYRAAVEKKVKIVTEDEFFEKYDPEKAPDPSADMLAAGLAAAATATNAATASAAASGSAAKSSSAGDPQEADTSLWVDKYRPASAADLIGHAETARKLSDWLTRWHAVHVAKTQKVPFSKENPGAKAVLLSGPPGIGKSSLAHTIARTLSFNVLEFNASDTRNKKEIESKLVEAVSSRALSLSLHGKQSASANTSASVSLCSRRVVVMDEVDGMGGSDRGGLQELLKVIKTSKIPIICICNDRQSPKIRSLANHCFDLRVKRPMKAQIAQRLVAIAQSEGLVLESNAALLLVEQSGNDIRQALNALQMWSSSQRDNKYLSFAAMKQGMSRIEKDKVLRQTPFDACGLLLGGDKADFEERFSSFFLDYSLVPLLVQQNYIDSARSGVMRNANMSEGDRLEALARAAHSVSDSDIIGSMIRGADQHWELLPSQAALCVKAGHHVRGFQDFPTFPQWLGKYSTTNKKSRLTRELVSHSSLSLREGFLPMRMDYVFYMKDLLLRPLLRDGKEAVPNTISMLSHYGLTRDDFMESMRELQFSPEHCKNIKDLYEGLDTQTKTAFTRAYNSSGLMSSTVVPEIGAPRKAKKVKSEDEDALLDDEAEVVEEEPENDEEEDVEALRAQLAAKKPAAKSRAKSAPKPSEGAKKTAKKK